ncbi:MAG: AAA family ATPase [Balneolaceae bacterium]
MNISDELTPNDIQAVSHQLGIELNDRPGGDGWITTLSPLREEKNPSFGFNVNTGAWKDHSTGDTGDLVNLAEVINRMDRKEAVQWIKEQTDLGGALYTPPKNGTQKKVKPFWTKERLQLIKSGREQILSNSKHPLLRTTEEYDCLHPETLHRFGCSVIEMWGSEWLAFPYPTGCQLYRRDNEEKNIRSVKGSTPSGAFFGMKRAEGKSKLFIAKSPRETMLLSQIFGSHADAIGLCTGEQGNTSKEQRSSLRRQISNPDLSHIYIFLDCDTEMSHQTAKEFTGSVQEIANEVEFTGAIRLVNIHKQTGAYKDVTDCIRAGMDEDTFNHLLDSSDVFNVQNTNEMNVEHPTWFKPSDPFKESVPDLEFVIDGYCARGLITVIGGSAGSGKSLFNQILFQKRNDELLPTQPGKAIYLTGADSSEFEIRRRAKAINENNGLLTVSIPEDLYCVATNETFMQELTSQVIQCGADAVIFDTLADFHEGNLYEAELANRTMRAFTRLARNANVAVLLITHTRKGSKIKTEYNVEDISDSRVFGTKADFVFGLKSEYQQDGSNLIELQCVKSRSSQPIQPLRAEIYFNPITDELKIRQCDRLFSAELESQSKDEKREHNIKEVHRLKDEGKSIRETSKQLNISVGSVSNYLKEKPLF